MKLLMLKEQLMSIFTKLLLCASQMSFHTIAMSDLGETLTTLGLETIQTLLST